MENDLKDEDLIALFKAGDANALNELYKRHYDRIHYFLLKESHVKNDFFLDDVRQEIFETALKEIKEGGFASAGDGSFRAWFYSLAKNVCWNRNYGEAKEPKHIYGFMMDLVTSQPPPSPEAEDERREEVKEELNKVLAELEPEEITLMQMVSDGKTYAKIHETPEFNKYSIDYLMLKVYNIRKKLFKLR